MVDKWIENGVLNNRNAERSTSPWTEMNLQKALKACRFKKQGIDEHNALICEIWLDREDYPAHVIERAFREEFRRHRRNLVRNIRSTYILKPDKKLTPIRKSIIIKQMGEAHPAFVQARIAPNEALTLFIYELMRYGKNSQNFDGVNIEELLLKHFGAFGVDNIFPISCLRPFIPFILKALSGMAEDAFDPDRLSENRDELRNEFEREFRQASQHNWQAFCEARNRMRWFLDNFTSVAALPPVLMQTLEGNMAEHWKSISELHVALKQPPWSVFLFIFFLNMFLVGNDKAFQETMKAVEKKLTPAEIKELLSALDKANIPLDNLDAVLFSPSNQPRLK